VRSMDSLPDPLESASGAESPGPLEEASHSHRPIFLGEKAKDIVQRFAHGCLIPSAGCPIAWCALAASVLACELRGLGERPT
jgi:hypothetical protein